VDPLAELTPSISPYAYCKGNPVNAIDPTGMYSTQEWMDDNGVTDKDVMNVYKAPNENKENKIEKPEPLNELKEKFLNFFGWDLNPADPKYLKKLDEGSKNREKAAEKIDETNKFLIVNGALFFVGEGAAYCIEEFGGAILVRIVGKHAIQAAEAGENSLIALGRGSTGRTIANTLEEQLTMKEIIFNPADGEVISNMKPLTDSRWFGWRKMQYIKELSNGTKINIHYVGEFENGILTAVDDFKFK